jgi:hypothetical protein
LADFPVSQPQLLGQVVERRERHRVISAHHGRLAHPGAHDRAVLMDQLDDQLLALVDG